jgi:hypothetical protein
MAADDQRRGRDRHVAIVGARRWITHCRGGERQRVGLARPYGVEERESRLRDPRR